MDRKEKNDTNDIPPIELVRKVDDDPFTSNHSQLPNAFVKSVSQSDGKLKVLLHGNDDKKVMAFELHDKEWVRTDEGTAPAPKEKEAPEKEPKKTE